MISGGVKGIFYNIRNQRGKNIKSVSFIEQLRGERWLKYNQKKIKTHVVQEKFKVLFLKARSINFLIQRELSISPLLVRSSASRML